MDTVKNNAPTAVPAIQEIAVMQAAPIAPAISQAPQVYAAINAVQTEIAVTGISKSNTTTGGAKFKFRGIDDVYNALSPLIAKHGLVIAPRFENRQLVERKAGSSGNALFYITITGHFDFISVKDGSKHTVTTFGEAMDSGDKGTNKAMAIAHKYALLQVFAIPTEGDNDPDNYTHNPQPYQGNNQQQNNNQTHVGQAQRMNTPPLRMAVLQFAMPETLGGKPKTSDGRRLFSPEQFRDLETSILNKQFKASDFLNPDKYYFSDEQFATLNNLNSGQLMIAR